MSFSVNTHINSKISYMGAYGGVYQFMGVSPNFLPKKWIYAPQNTPLTEHFYSDLFEKINKK